MGMTYPLSLLLPFGCFVIIFKTKKQVEEGKLDSRGLYGIFIGKCIAQGVKGIRVLTDMGNIEESCIWKSYWNVLPWRQPGNRMLLSSGVFGNEKETTALFTEVKAKYVPATATNLLNIDDDSTFFDAKKAQNDYEHANERYEKSKIAGNPRFQ